MDFYTGQILPLAIGYAPKQTAMCQGQTLPITQNQALFTLLGISFGGNGTLNFGLPNTGGRTIIGGVGGGGTMGAAAGEVSHTLALNEMPAHTHGANAITDGTATSVPVDAMPGTASASAYGGASSLVSLGGAPLMNAGGGQPHNNMQPSLPINFAIVLYGIFPTRP